MKEGEIHIIISLSFIMSKEKAIHWFPGHMKIALNEIEAKIKIVDVVIEVLDARIPLSSLNEELEKRIINKPRIYIINKVDLADPNEVLLMKNLLIQKNGLVVVGSLNENSTIKEIEKSIKNASQTKREKDIKRGLKPQPVKVMIIGIPNAGKSTLINKLSKRKAAGVENKPGFTRSEQWIHFDSYYLLDTPGVLQASYESEEKATKLALIGSIREDILPFYDLADSLIDILSSLYGNDFLFERFNIEIKEKTKNEIYELIAIKRGLLKGKDADIERAQKLLLKEYKDGLLGRYNLEKIHA